MGVIYLTQLELLKVFIPENEDGNIINACLELAKSTILNKRFPYLDKKPTEVEDQYKSLQIEMAIEIYNKIGAEGETAHSENGISRTYENTGVSQHLIDKIVPFCGVIK